MAGIRRLRPAHYFSMSLAGTLFYALLKFLIDSLSGDYPPPGAGAQLPADASAAAC